MTYAGGSSSSDANAFDFVGNIDDWVEMTNCRGSCLSSIVCPAAMEVAICFDLVTIYSLTADLGKKIWGELRQSDERWGSRPPTTDNAPLA